MGANVLSAMPRASPTGLSRQGRTESVLLFLCVLYGVVRFVGPEMVYLGTWERQALQGSSESVSRSVWGPEALRGPNSDCLLGTGTRWTRGRES